MARERGQRTGRRRRPLPLSVTVTEDLQSSRTIWRRVFLEAGDRGEPVDASGLFQRGADAEHEDMRPIVLDLVGLWMRPLQRSDANVCSWRRVLQTD